MHPSPPLQTHRRPLTGGHGLQNEAGGRKYLPQLGLKLQAEFHHLSPPQLHRKAGTLRGEPALTVDLTSLQDHLARYLLDGPSCGCHSMFHSWGSFPAICRGPMRHGADVAAHWQTGASWHTSPTVLRLPAPLSPPPAPWMG